MLTVLSFQPNIHEELYTNTYKSKNNKFIKNNKYAVDQSIIYFILLRQYNNENCL
jgi:hypothetical protein